MQKPARSKGENESPMASMYMLDEYGFEIFEHNDYPQAYLLTIRTFGTWLHGDRRGSVSRNETAVFGLPRNPPNEGLEKWMFEEMKHPAKILNKEECKVVETSIVELCQRKAYLLHAVNVRSNHAHAVITAQRKPERIIVEINANATKMLREAGLTDATERIWSRGKSRRYLWKPRNVNAAINYVLYGQGETIFVSEEWEDFTLGSSE